MRSNNGTPLMPLWSCSGIVLCAWTREQAIEIISNKTNVITNFSTLKRLKNCYNNTLEPGILVMNYDPNT